MKPRTFLMIGKNKENRMRLSNKTSEARHNAEVSHER